MISLCILMILLLAIIFIAVGIIGGTLVLFIDPIICILVIYTVIKLIKYFKDNSKR